MFHRGLPIFLEIHFRLIPLHKFAGARFLYLGEFASLSTDHVLQRAHSSLSYLGVSLSVPVWRRQENICGAAATTESPDGT